MEEKEGLDIYEGLSDDEMTAGFGDEEESPDTEPEPEVVEPVEEPEPEDQPEEEEPVEEEPVEGKTEDQLFTLNHLGEIKDYTREETIALAQKGLDYDRIRSERDSLKAEKAAWQENSKYEQFLKDLAETAGMDVDDLMIETKAKIVQQEEEKKGYNITLDQARYRVKAEMKQAPKRTAEPVEDPLIAKRTADFDEFSAEYPNVNANDIPKEVWEEYGDGSKKNFTAVFRKYENKQTAAQMETLRAEIESLKQEQTNKKRSTGSRRSNGSPPVDHDFDGWGDY